MNYQYGSQYNHQRGPFFHFKRPSRERWDRVSGRSQCSLPRRDDDGRLSQAPFGRTDPCFNSWHPQYVSPSLSKALPESATKAEALSSLNSREVQWNSQEGHSSEKLNASQHYRTGNYLAEESIDMVNDILGRCKRKSTTNALVGEKGISLEEHMEVGVWSNDFLNLSKPFSQESAALKNNEFRDSAAELKTKLSAEDSDSRLSCAGFKDPSLPFLRVSHPIEKVAGDGSTPQFSAQDKERTLDNHVGGVNVVEARTRGENIDKNRMAEATVTQDETQSLKRYCSDFSDYLASNDEATEDELGTTTPDRKSFFESSFLGRDEGIYRENQTLGLIQNMDDHVNLKKDKEASSKGEAAVKDENQVLEPDYFDALAANDAVAIHKASFEGHGRNIRLKEQNLDMCESLDDYTKLKMDDETSSESNVEFQDNCHSIKSLATVLAATDVVVIASQSDCQSIKNEATEALAPKNDVAVDDEPRVATSDYGSCFEELFDDIRHEERSADLFENQNDSIVKSEKDKERSSEQNNEFQDEIPLAIKDVTEPSSPIDAAIKDEPQVQVTSTSNFRSGVIKIILHENQHVDLPPKQDINSKSEKNIEDPSESKVAVQDENQAHQKAHSETSAPKGSAHKNDLAGTAREYEAGWELSGRGTRLEKPLVDPQENQGDFLITKNNEESRSESNRDYTHLGQTEVSDCFKRNGTNVNFVGEASVQSTSIHDNGPRKREVQQCFDALDFSGPGFSEEEREDFTEPSFRKAHLPKQGQNGEKLENLDGSVRNPISSETAFVVMLESSDKSEQEYLKIPAKPKRFKPIKQRKQKKIQSSRAKTDCVASDSTKKDENKEGETRFVLGCNSSRISNNVDDSSDVSRSFHASDIPSSKQFSKSSGRASNFQQFSYLFSLEDAEKEQERLFKESAARVRLQAQFLVVGHDYVSGSTVFDSTIPDIANSYPHHWKYNNFYSRLGLPQNASIQLVKSQYRKLALLYHPDKSKSYSTSVKFQAITEAYQGLVGR